MITTHSVRETRELGARLAALLSPGDTVVLRGNLGAGKSEFARGVARGLGVSGPVPSPSFTILNAYDEGRIPLYHFDWYRLQDAEEIHEMGLDEMIGGDGAALIEWSERAPDAVPRRALQVDIRTVDENTREFVFTPLGGFPFSEEQIA